MLFIIMFSEQYRSSSSPVQSTWLRDRASHHCAALCRAIPLVPKKRGCFPNVRTYGLPGLRAIGWKYSVTLKPPAVIMPTTRISLKKMLILSWQSAEKASVTLCRRLSSCFFHKNMVVLYWTNNEKRLILYSTRSIWHVFLSVYQNVLCFWFVTFLLSFMLLEAGAHTNNINI